MVKTLKGSKKNRRVFKISFEWKERYLEVRLVRKGGCTYNYVCRWKGEKTLHYQHDGN